MLVGARQVGKTTLLRTLPSALSVNLANEDEFLTYARRPARLIREVRALKSRSPWVTIDEVQRLPRLLDSVQVLLDEGSPYRFLLTGSSARKLRRGRANLLPGRVVQEKLYPLTVAEVGSDFDLDRALRLGCLPGIYLDEAYGADLLESYATTYLREEIQAEALVRDVGSYARFLDIAAVQSGRFTNYSKLAVDAEIAKETLRRFYAILEDTLVAVRVPPYRPQHTSRRVSQRDKFVIFDVGVRNALLGLLRSRLAPEEEGTLFEQFILLQCMYFNHATRRGWKIYSYRDHGGTEVDIVLQTPERLVAIECKAGRQVRRTAARPLRSFERVADRGSVRKIVVYRGERRQQLDDEIEVIPWREFLLQEIQRL